MAWTVNDIPNQAGRVAVIAGPHCPEGLATARHLVRSDAQVVLVGGSTEALVELRGEVFADVATANVTIVAIAEPTAAATVAAAEAVLAVHPRIDLLIHNSCPMMPADAPLLDSVPAVTFPAIGHFAFTATLMPGLAASPTARIVTITPQSDIHDLKAGVDLVGDIEIAQIEVVDPDPPISLLDFPVELHRRLRDANSPVQSLAADPGRHGDGVVATIDKAAGALSRIYARRQADRRAESQLQAATDPAAVGGELYTPMFNTSGKPMRLPMRGSRQPAVGHHWDTTATLTGTNFDPTLAAACTAAPDR